MRLMRKIHAVVSICMGVTMSLQADMISTGASSLISQDHAEAIYKNLVQTHWVPQTGLFLSFPDSSDRKLSQQASLYEQAAMGLLAIRFDDIDRANGIYHFLKEAWFAIPLKPGPLFGTHGLPNFFNGEFGTEGIEKTIHVGPNAWVGLFAARLANRTHDPEVLQWALDIAYWIENGIPHENGAVAMGAKDDPHGAPWAHVYSTENNLSYYGFLTELLRSPRIDLANRERITQERDRVENWIVHTAFNPVTYSLNRGTNPQGADTLPALDTVTWIISAIGPRHLAARGIDPDRLMQKAEKSFEVEVQGHPGVDPTDQGEADYTYASDPKGRPDAATRPSTDHHRMIWYEGMGQYILALSTLSEYSEHEGRAEQARLYSEKARRMMRELDRAALKNYPAGAAYPYATAGKFFRDGWRTPAESSDGPASSLITAVWRCFAGLGTDPLSGRDIGGLAHVRVITPHIDALAKRKPAILYGTSEDMVVQAWKALNENDMDQAIEQARATIQEWTPWALQLQQKKMNEVGHLLDYNGSPEEQRAIFNYWALNDVGAAYYILGKALDEKKDYLNAARAFQEIVNHYSLAQVWDPKGWFWAPATAIADEYVFRDQTHYGGIMPQVLAEGSVSGKLPN